jgi:hypothetical protein
MIFTNNQKNMMRQVPVPNSYTTAFSAKYLRSHPPILAMPNEHARSIPRQFSFDGKPSTAKTPTTVALPEKPATPELPQQKPMKWGEPTWFMFHTIAEKIKPEYYIQYRSEIMNIIRIVCNTLPCPICANHATQYMQNINDSQLSTKEDLQRMLWAFHNSVNERKGLPFFPNDNGQLRAKYSKANTRSIIQHFLIVHKDKQSGFRMMADDFYRNKNINMIKTWFARNISIFEN